MRKFFVIVGAILASSCLRSQDSTSIPLKETLDKIVIVANKFPQKQSQTGKVVSVIDNEMIQQMGGRTAGEILNTVSGTTIIGANSNPGTNQRISIRGSGDGNVLILVDGIPENDPSVISNYYDLNFINVTQIERIEILKGGQSTLYGSDAVGGVINIITKKNSVRNCSTYGSLSYGSYATVNTTGGLRGNPGNFSYNFSGGIVNSNGFSSAFDPGGNNHFDKDGYHQYNFRTDASLQLSKLFRISFFERYNYYKTGLDAGAFTDDKDFNGLNKSLETGMGFSLKQKGGMLHFNYAFNYVNRFYLDDSSDRSSFAYYSKGNYTGRTHFTEVYENIRFKNTELLTGADFHFYNTAQDYFSVSTYGPFYSPPLLASQAKQWLLSPYASAIYHYFNLNLEMGARFNLHNLYGNNLTYSFNPFYFINGKLKLFANISSAFKVPSLYQLFDSYSGNKDLNAEKSSILESGAEFFPDNRFKIRATYFYRNTSNAIQYVITDPVNFIGRYQNINNIKNFGAESELNFQVNGLNITANYTYTKGRLKSTYGADGTKLGRDTSYNNLYRVPQDALNVFSSFKITSEIIITALLKYSGKRQEPVFASAPVILGDYFTIDMGAQYLFCKSIRAFIDLKNITDRKYFDISGYSARRFNFSLGILMNFN